MRHACDAHEAEIPLLQRKAVQAAVKQEQLERSEPEELTAEERLGSGWLGNLRSYLRLAELSGKEAQTHESELDMQTRIHTGSVAGLALSGYSQCIIKELQLTSF